MTQPGWRECLVGNRRPAGCNLRRMRPRPEGLQVYEPETLAAATGAAGVAGAIHFASSGCGGPAIGFAPAAAPNCVVYLPARIWRCAGTWSARFQHLLRQRRIFFFRQMKWRFSGRAQCAGSRGSGFPDLAGADGKTRRIQSRIRNSFPWEWTTRNFPRPCPSPKICAIFRIPGSDMWGTSRTHAGLALVAGTERGPSGMVVRFCRAEGVRTPRLMNCVRQMSTSAQRALPGGKPTESLGAYPQHFDVCLMPYRMDDYTKYVYPLKMHEYLAGGKPVVSSRIRSVEDFRHVVTIAGSREEWSQAIEQALSAEENTPDAAPNGRAWPASTTGSRWSRKVARSDRPRGRAG